MERPLLTASILTVVIVLLLSACSQVPTGTDELDLSNQAVTLNAGSTPRGALPATVRWPGGGLNLRGCVWREFDRERPNVQYDYLERSRSSSHLVVYDRSRDRYLSLPRAGGQARWRKGATGTWYKFRTIGAFTLPARTIAYNSFNGVTSSRRLCPGRWISLLLIPRSDSDLLTTKKVVPAIDAAYTVYRRFTGKNPELFFTALGRASVAEVPEGATCGAGCAYLGFTGIEMMSPYMDLLLRQAGTRNEYDQVVFYELGRNFWFYGDQLGALDPFVTGFAIAGRFISMKEAGLKGAPFNGVPLATIRKAAMEDLLASYLNDDTLTWRNTLGEDRAPANPYHFGAADLAGAMIWRIYEEHGLSGLTAFFAKLAERPNASTQAAAATNFVAAAYAAFSEDYRYLFKDNTLQLR